MEVRAFKMTLSTIPYKGPTVCSGASRPGHGRSNARDLIQMKEIVARIHSHHVGNTLLAAFRVDPYALEIRA